MTFQKVLYATSVARSTVTPFDRIKLLPTWPVTTYLLLNGVWIVAGCVFFILAVFLFGRLEGNFAEEL